MVGDLERETELHDIVVGILSVEFIQQRRTFKAKVENL